LWDAILSFDENRFEFIHFICVAILTVLREELLNGSFAEIMLLLQDISKIDVNKVINQANIKYIEFFDSK
jgi:TBC1 domain family member 13